ncbi:MAG: hypothetical protein IRY99_21385 [Isosphaeraceae bacterium]|nr:hypothetical protein [Isosphaeraceae bacterium]
MTMRLIQSEPRGNRPEGCEEGPRSASEALRARLGWREGGRDRETSARLVSVREEGLSLVCAVAPPAGRPARVYLAGVATDIAGPVEATVMAVTRPLPGAHLVRLGFNRACPRAWLRAALARLGDEGAGEPEVGTSA